ncbi:MAG TPA: regulatory protein RecX [Ktedonobacterales bacterium]|nr:regulatory protein RecX [Ktedonobacterales bacterium]
MKITALEPQARHPTRYNLALDGRFACGLDMRIVLDQHLAVGGELTEADVTRLRALDDERGLFDAAVRFLGPRPRSRSEVRTRLMRPRPNQPPPAPETVNRVLDRLAELELLDDRQFAEFWIENRERFSPRSSRALGAELRQRGVARETVEELAEPERDDERALAAARPRLRGLAGADYETFRTRLGGFLLRRGFSYGVAAATTRALWEETHGDAPDETEGNESPDDLFPE